MASIFTKIIHGEIPSYKVAEEGDFYAFLDINPLNEGHTLVIPKKEVDYLFDLEDDLYNRLFAFAKKVAAAIDKTISCKRVAMVVYGLDVPHAHIHLIPLHGKGNELNFANPKVKLTSEEFQKIANDINKNYL